MNLANILIVEDDASLAELLVWNFTKAGYTVRQTPDGDEALLLASEQAPDLVVLDWMIEGTSGIEVCRRLRKNKSTENVPIIMLTARGEEDDRIRGLDTGADDYVTKPFSPRELLARVGAIMRRIRPALAGETLLVGDLRSMPSPTGSSGVGRFWRLAPPNFVCCAISWNTPAAYFRATSCSMRYGARAVISRCAQSTSTSAVCARPSNCPARPIRCARCAQRDMHWKRYRELQP